MKVYWEFETDYEIGDFVIFKAYETTRVGRIIGINFDSSENCIWYAIKADEELFARGSENLGEVAEFDIIGKIEDQRIIERLVDERIC